MAGQSREFLTQIRKLKRKKRGYTDQGMRDMPEREAFQIKSQDEILSWLGRTENDPWHLLELPVTPMPLAAATGTTYRNILKFLREFNSQPVMAKISQLIDEVEARRVVWGNLATKRADGAGFGKIVIVYLEPPAVSPRIPRFCQRAAWSIFTACLHCGGNKWLPVESDGKQHVACYTCLPPNQYGALGIRPSKEKLIREYVRKRHG